MFIVNLVKLITHFYSLMCRETLNSRRKFNMYNDKSEYLSKGTFGIKISVHNSYEFNMIKDVSQ